MMNAIEKLADDGPKEPQVTADKSTNKPILDKSTKEGYQYDAKYNVYLKEVT